MRVCVESDKNTCEWKVLENVTGSRSNHSQVRRTNEREDNRANRSETQTQGTSLRFRCSATARLDRTITIFYYTKFIFIESETVQK